jgi:hypothetical protein
VPADVAEIAVHSKAIVQAILFDGAAAKLKTNAADPKASWRQDRVPDNSSHMGSALTRHPHVHSLVPSGARSSGGRWLGRRPNVLLPIRVLSRRFRQLFPKRLQAAHAAGQLRFSGGPDNLGDAEAFKAVTWQLRRKQRVVCSKPPFGPPEHVLAYLGRYTHRVAIANSRLIRANENSVTFRWNDCRRGKALRLMSLDPHEFIRRFLMHSLPDGFHRIRHSIMPAKGCRRTRIATLRQLPAMTKPDRTAATGKTTRSFPRFDPTVCPCRGGFLRVTVTLPRWRSTPSQP